LPAGASGEQMTWERICVVIMFSRIYLRRRARRIDEPQATGFSNPLNAPSQGDVPNSICGMSNFQLTTCLLRATK
jgi:hypothetical protein